MLNRQAERFFFFKDQSCTYLVKILPPTLAAEFCVRPMDYIYSTTFGILKLGTLHGQSTLPISHRRLVRPPFTYYLIDIVILKDSWLACLPC